MIRILVPLDGSALAECALPHAQALARAFPAEITLLRVVGEALIGAAVHADAVDAELERRQAEMYLTKLRKSAIDPEIDVEIRVAEGLPAAAIKQCCAELRPDLIVMTRYGAGEAAGFAAGGTAQKVSESADCSLMLLDHATMRENVGYQRILVPIDDCLDSEYVIGLASMLAQAHGASLRLLRVAEEPQLPPGLPATKHATEIISDLRELVFRHAQQRLDFLAALVPDSVKVDTRLQWSSDAPYAINAEAAADKSDLIMINAKASNPQGVWRYGSLVYSLLQHAERPILIVQPSTDCDVLTRFRSAYLREPTRDAG